MFCRRKIYQFDLLNNVKCKYMFGWFILRTELICSLYIWHLIGTKSDLMHFILAKESHNNFSILMFLSKMLYLLNEKGIIIRIFALHSRNQYFFFATILLMDPKRFPQIIFIQCNRKIFLILFKRRMNVFETNPENIYK